MANVVQLKQNNESVYPITDDSLVIPAAGTTEERPETAVVGARYFDTTLGKPVWFNGEEWIEVSGSDDAVLYTPQTLTEEQKAQARENIGAGSGGSSDVFWATYNSTTYADIVSAYNAGKVVVCSYDNTTYVLSRIDNNYAYFGGINQTILYFLRVRASDSVYYKSQYNAEVTSNKVSTISGNETNTTKYPNTKAVYDFVKALADANGLTMP